MLRSAKTHDSTSAFAYFVRMNGQLLKFSGSGSAQNYFGSATLLKSSIYAKLVPVTEFLECNETRLSRPMAAALVSTESALYRG
jgi:hypothetical protein